MMRNWKVLMPFERAAKQGKDIHSKKRASSQIVVLHIVQRWHIGYYIECLSVQGVVMAKTMLMTSSKNTQ